MVEWWSAKILFSICRNKRFLVQPNSFLDSITGESFTPNDKVEVRGFLICNETGHLLSNVHFYLNNRKASYEFYH